MLGVDFKGRLVIVVEGAEAAVLATVTLQRNVLADKRNDIDRPFDKGRGVVQTST
jgi:hypothetical protein